jgi:hypothetical protein
VNGNDLSWKVSITDPMPLTLEFSGVINGDEMSGSVKLGAFGMSSFTRPERPSDCYATEKRDELALHTQAVATPTASTCARRMCGQQWNTGHRQAYNCRRELWSCNSPLGVKSFTARGCSTAMPKARARSSNAYD